MTAQMKWYELAANPLAVTSIYTEVPSLESALLKEIILDRNGPQVIWKIELPTFPDKPPARWKFRDYNIVQLELHLWELASINIRLWTPHNEVHASIDPAEDGWISFKAISPGCNIQLLTRGFGIAFNKRKE